MAEATIAIEALTGLGRCALAVDDQGVVRWASERLSELLGGSIVGRVLGRLTVPMSHPIICLGIRMANGGTLPLRGSWITSSEGTQRVFVGAPAPLRTEEIAQLGVTMEDYLESDSWLNYLILADECAAIQLDARERIQQLNEERAKLSQARDQMRAARRAALNMLADVAEAKQQAERANAELEAAHTKTRQLLEAVPSVLISVDVGSCVTAWNGAAERTFGIPSADAVGHPLGELSVRWDCAPIERAVAKYQASSRPVRIDELRFTRPDGTEGFLGITLSPVSTGAGANIGFLLVADDITEQKILQGQLAQAQKLESIGQLAAGIAHEINTPTQFVGDNTRFLQDSVQDLIGIVDRYEGLLDRDQAPRSWEERSAEIKAALDELDVEFLRVEIPKAIEQSLEGVERVAKIVRSMKEFSHPGGDDLQAVDLNRAIESTVTVARNEWKYVAEMVTDFDPRLPPVPCLAGDFNQVILNIVINAAHAISDVVGKNSGNKGTITVTTRQDGEWVEIRIADDGTGIPEAHRSKVFDHFFTTKEVGRGTGQGLAIAHSVITEKHHGSITFESEVGRGTTFIIRLPVEPLPQAVEEPVQHEAAYSVR